MNHSIDAHQQLLHLIEADFQTFYQIQLGHHPNKIVCQFFQNTLAIVVKGSVTKPEKLLLKHGQQNLAQRVRLNLEQLMRPQLKSLIEGLTQADVEDLLIDTHLRTDQTSVIAILSHPPSLACQTASHASSGMEP
ncbi:DUF2294 domain-containing protein [Egbenema bharatensis]|uniref:DUF2294 domain-containing protein n=1 Tax=Egbenema bharatensis TaxID=3463334 RepID=UPI003A8B0DA6